MSAHQYGMEAMLATRARFFVLYRLAVRLQQFRLAEGAAHESGEWRIVLLGFVMLDIVLWRLLRNPRRFAFKSRLVLDAVDMAVWSAGPYPPGARYDVAVFVGVPLAMEAGLRMRWGALAVPAAGLVSTAIARNAAGVPFSAATTLWLFGSVVGGWLLRGYDRRLRRQVERAWADRRSADEKRAFLAGQNSIAMGASSIVDGIESLVPILGRPPRHSALEILARGWKADLGLSTRALSSAGGQRTAVYLGDALSEWSAEYNRHPDLSSRVELPLSEGSGTCLLSGEQAAALRHLLTRLNLVGRHRVELADLDAHFRPPGKSLRLRIGAHEVEVPADADQPPRPCDPAPLAFFLVAAQIVRDMSPTAIYLPPVIALGGVASCLAASVWSHVRLRDRGLAARGEILWVALALAAGLAVAADLTMRHPFTPAGDARYTFAEGLLAVLLLLGMYEGDMQKAGRWVAALGVGAIVALGWLFHPAHETNPYTVAFELLQPWLIVVYLCGRKASAELRTAEAAYAAALHAGDAAAIAAAFRSGQESVVDLVRKARDDAVLQLAQIQATLDRRLLQSASQRLKEVDERLAALVPS